MQVHSLMCLGSTFYGFSVTALKDLSSNIDNDLPLGGNSIHVCCHSENLNVTLYLQRCLAFKRCSVSSLPKPLYQIKAYGAGYQTIRRILK